jgi:hypothetical protein
MPRKSPAGSGYRSLLSKRWHDELEARGSNPQKCGPPTAMVPPANAGSPPPGVGVVAALSGIVLPRKQTCGKAGSRAHARVAVVLDGRAAPGYGRR